MHNRKSTNISLKQFLISFAIHFGWLLIVFIFWQAITIDFRNPIEVRSFAESTIFLALVLVIAELILWFLVGFKAENITNFSLIKDGKLGLFGSILLGLIIGVLIAVFTSHK